MQDVFEKIIEKLEEKARFYNSASDVDQNIRSGVIIAKEVVQEEADEHKGGWIPCSERLPEDDSICIVTVEYPNNKTVVDYGWFDRKNVCWFVGMQEFRTSNILAWQPLPQPYKSKGE